MKMLMTIIDSSHKEELEVMLKHEGVTGWTEISHVRGMGSSGERLGSLTSPDTSAVVLALLKPEDLERVVSRVRSYCSECAERIKMMHWDVTVEL